MRTLDFIGRRVALLALVALCACGGSDGGGGGADGGGDDGGVPGGAVYGPALLSGPYRMMTLTTDDDAGITVARWQPGQADGVSVLQRLAGAANTNGVVAAVDLGDLDYTVSATGTIDLLVADTPILRGGITSDGVCALLASLDPGTVAITVLVRADSGLAVADLDVDYGAAGFSSDVSTPSYLSLVAELQFDGAGGMPYDALVNVEGSITTGTVPGGTYGVSGGTLALDLSGLSLEGVIVPGGAFGVAAGDVLGGTPAADPFLLALARQGSGLDDADLVGDYHAIGIEVAAGVVRVFSASLTADGSGAFNASGTVNDGTTTGALGFSGTYAVAADGGVTVNRGVSEDLTGQVSDDGCFATLGGGALDGSDTVFWILARK